MGTAQIIAALTVTTLVLVAFGCGVPWGRRTTRAATVPPPNASLAPGEPSPGVLVHWSLRIINLTQMAKTAAAWERARADLLCGVDCMRGELARMKWGYPDGHAHRGDSDDPLALPGLEMRVEREAPAFDVDTQAQPVVVAVLGAEDDEPSSLLN